MLTQPARMIGHLPAPGKCTMYDGSARMAGLESLDVWIVARCGTWLLEVNGPYGARGDAFSVIGKRRTAS